MVEMQMAHDYSFDVFDIIAGCLDGIGQLMLLLVNYSGEHICQRGTPFLVSDRYYQCSDIQEADGWWIELTTSIFSAQPVSNRIRPASG